MSNPLVGQRIGKFRIVEQIGEGGMGLVFRATDEQLRRTVALKVIPEDWVSDEIRRQRFIREARAAAAVSHPNIATIYEAGEDDERVYIAMEYIRGQTLRELVAQRSLPFGRAVEIASQIVRALQRAHGAGVVHRDLKPENIMIDDQGQVKILDFGLARRAASPVLVPTEELASANTELVAPRTNEDSDEFVTAAGQVLGTPGYMSPEQAQGRPVDSPTDIFSLGAVFYEMLAGKGPFADGTTMELIIATARDTHRPVSESNPDVPLATERLIDRCLAKDPQQRPTADELNDELSTIQEEFGANRSLARESKPTEMGSKSQRTDASQRSIDALTQSQSEAAPLPRSLWLRRLVILSATIGASALVGFGYVHGWFQASTSTTNDPPTGTEDPQTTAAASHGLTSAKPTPTTLTELPVPKSNNPEAIRHYQKGIHAMRDGDWEGANQAFEKAIEADPDLAIAHLRHAMTQHFHYRDTSGCRSAFRRATQLRASLDSRNRALLNGLEPLFAAVPTDLKTAHDRLTAAAERWPGDAEFFLLLGTVRDVLGLTETGLEAVNRARTLDPNYADAWQIRGQMLARLGRVQEAQEAFDRCVDISTATVDCLYDRSLLRSLLGQCERAVADGRLLITRSPSKDTYGFFAQLLAGSQAPREALEEALELRWKYLPDAQRNTARLSDLAFANLLTGRFDLVERRLRQLEEKLAGETGENRHFRNAYLLVTLLLETERGHQAGRVATAFLKRRAAWSHVRINLQRDGTLWMHRVKLETDRGYRDEFERVRQRWMTQWRGRGTTDDQLWLMGYADVAWQSDEAQRAMQVIPEKFNVNASPRDEIKPALVGRTFLLAGNPRRALPSLTRAANQCVLRARPTLPIRANLWLGQAHEQLGHKDKACGAYGRIVERWKNARPRSVTVQRARRRMNALECSQPKPATK